MHPFLQRQRLQYTIVVVNQTGIFVNTVKWSHEKKVFFSSNDFIKSKWLKICLNNLVFFFKSYILASKVAGEFFSTSVCDIRQKFFAPLGKKSRIFFYQLWKGPFLAIYISKTNICRRGSVSARTDVECRLPWDALPPSIQAAQHILYVLHRCRPGVRIPSAGTF